MKHYKGPGSDGFTAEMFQTVLDKFRAFYSKDQSIIAISLKKCLMLNNLP